MSNEDRIQKLTEERNQLITHLQRLQAEVEGVKAMLNQVVGKIELLTELSGSQP